MCPLKYAAYLYIMYPSNFPNQTIYYFHCYCLVTLFKAILIENIIQGALICSLQTGMLYPQIAGVLHSKLLHVHK